MRNFGARITDRFSFDGLRTVIVENELLRRTFLVDRGCDIVELLHKPKDIDFIACWIPSPKADPRDRFSVPRVTPNRLSSLSSRQGWASTIVRFSPWRGAAMDFWAGGIIGSCRMAKAYESRDLFSHYCGRLNTLIITGGECYGEKTQQDCPGLVGLHHLGLGHSA